jgi:hypothetical protein
VPAKSSPLLNMKKIVSFLSLLLCFPLVACNHYTTTADITYVMEEEPFAYPNNRYLPLLDVIQQFKNFHEEELTTRENPYISEKGEEEAAKQWDEANAMYNQSVRRLIIDLERHVLGLLNATITINEYLTELVNIQDYLFSAHTELTTQYLLSIKTGIRNMLIPTSKKLFEFLMKDKTAFGEHEDINERTRLRAIIRFELLKQLIQTAIDLTDSNDFNEKSISLLNKVKPYPPVSIPMQWEGPMCC